MFAQQRIRDRFNFILSLCLFALILILLIAFSDIEAELKHGLIILATLLLMTTFSAFTNPISKQIQAPDFKQGYKPPDIYEFAEKQLAKGNLYLIRDMPEEAKPKLQLAQSLYQELGDSLGEAFTSLSLSIDYMELHQNDEAIQTLKKVRHEFQKLNKPAGEAIALYQLGSIYQVQGDSESIHAYEEANAILQQRGSDYRISSADGALISSSSDTSSSSNIEVRTLLQPKKILTFLDKLNRLDLEPIAYQLMYGARDSGWSLEKTRDAILQYKGFLLEAYLFPDKSISPNEVADRVWHTHILVDTQQYQKDYNWLFK